MSTRPASITWSGSHVLMHSQGLRFAKDSPNFLLYAAGCVRLDPNEGVICYEILKSVWCLWCVVLQWGSKNRTGFSMVKGRLVFKWFCIRKPDKNVMFLNGSNLPWPIISKFPKISKNSKKNLNRPYYHLRINQYLWSHHIDNIKFYRY